ncbi:MAG: hypothetical protein WD847_15115 [Pirellulales bacterium]
MRLLTSLCVAVVLAGGVSLAEAKEIKSGLEPGKFIDAFDVVKCAGAADDGVEVGDQLCYRCKYGGRPMVMVFARKSDKNLVSLVKKLDTAVEKNSDKELAAFVNLVGEDREALETEAKKLGEKNKVQKVAIVVPVEFENGPENYGISPDATVTVILAAGGKVVANHAVGEDGLDEDSVKAILADVKKLVK